MPNPYEDFFNPSDKQNKKEGKEEEQHEEFMEDSSEFSFPENQAEPLDEILASINAFNELADSFSKLLSKSKAVDHKVNSGFATIFLVTTNKSDQKSLIGEKQYHQLLINKFLAIIVPMKELAKIHLATVRQFNRDIDKNYYSIEKLDSQVKQEKAQAIDGINLQRKILSDAAEDLEILKDALAATERRIGKYINAGGHNNISSSEAALMQSKRTTLTNGTEHQFDYSFFNINLFDKTVISLGVYMQKTTSQYLAKLAKAVDAAT